MTNLGIFEISLFAFVFFAMAYLLTPLLIRIAKHYDLVDRPNQFHKTHLVSVPYLGGFAIIIPLVLGALFAPIYFDGLIISYREILGFIIAPLLISIVGAIDDKFNLPPFPRFVAQFVFSLLILVVFSDKDMIGNVFVSEILNIVLTMVWLIGITNALNFFDNLDGGAAGFAVIASLTVFVLANSSGQFVVALAAIALSASCLGFLVWNRAPARIYLGDAGALFIGMLLAALLIRFDPVSKSPVVALMTSILVMFIPILDTSVAVISRIKRGLSPFQGGKDHLSHRLQRKGLNRKKSAISLWSLSSLFCALAILIQYVNLFFQNSLIVLGMLGGVILFVWFFRQPDHD